MHALGIAGGCNRRIIEAVSKAADHGGFATLWAGDHHDRIATGVPLSPEHNPVIVAKQTASLDKLSGGRFTLGIRIGWPREEFEALSLRALRASGPLGAR